MTKIPLKLIYDQNNPKTIKWPKYPWNLENDQNAPKPKKWSKMPLNFVIQEKYTLKLKNYQNPPEN